MRRKYLLLLTNKNDIHYIFQQRVVGDPFVNGAHESIQAFHALFNFITLNSVFVQRQVRVHHVKWHENDIITAQPINGLIYHGRCCCVEFGGQLAEFFL